MPIYIPTCLLFYLTKTGKAARWKDRYIFTYLLIHLPTYVLIYLPAYVLIYLATHLRIYLLIYLFTFLAIQQFAVLLNIKRERQRGVSIDAYLHIYLFTYLPNKKNKAEWWTDKHTVAYFPIYLSTCVLMYLSTYLFTYLLIYFVAFLLIQPSRPI